MSRPGLGLRMEVGETGPVHTTGWLWADDGSGTGLHVWHGDDSDESSLVELAEQIQEVVQEEGPGCGWPSNWPSCLEHPGSHPAQSALRDGQAVWICPHLPEARATIIGQLEHGR